MKASERVLLGGAIVLLCAAPLALTLLGDLLDRFSLYAVIAVSSAATLVLLHAWLRHRGIELSRTTILLVALAARLAALPMAPTLSDDVWRYLWDGRLVLHGINPYLLAPSDPSLSDYRDPLYGLQGHRETPTVYPPAAQLLFAVAATPSFFAPLVPTRVPDWHGVAYYLLKLGLVAIELVAIWTLLRLLDHLALPRRGAVLYAWHPLVVVELAGQGHYDGVWIATLALALFAAAAGTRGRGVPWLVWGGFVRLFPFALLPLWARREGMTRSLVGLALALPIALVVVPFIAPGALESFLIVVARYTNEYEFNGGFYYLVKATLDGLSIAPSNRIAGGIGTAVQLAMLIVATARLRRGDSIARLVAASLLVVTAIVALGPKAHPWYFAAPLFLATLDDRSPLARAWLWIALVAPLTYLAYAGDTVRESAWLLWLEWGGGLLVALATWWRSWHERA